MHVFSWHCARAGRDGTRAYFVDLDVCVLVAAFGACWPRLAHCLPLFFPFFSFDIQCAFVGAFFCLPELRERTHASLQCGRRTRPYANGRTRTGSSQGQTRPQYSPLRRTSVFAKSGLHSRTSLFSVRREYGSIYAHNCSTPCHSINLGYYSLAPCTHNSTYIVWLVC